MKNRLTNHIASHWQKLKLVGSKYFTNRYPGPIFVLFLVVVILLTTYLTSQQHDLRKQARTKTPSFVPTQTLQPQADVQRPAGVFGVFPINKLEKFDVGEFKTDLSTVLNNQAVSGVVLRERWENLESGEGIYDFSRIDTAVGLAAARNKKVQLILVPGFFTPQWLLAKIPSCEPFLSKSMGPPVDCGKATFTVSYGPDSGETRELPLPWNSTYKQAWQKFVQEVANRYNPQKTVVSIAVAGPTSMSAEMSLPNETDEEKEKWRQLLVLFFPDLDITDPNTNPNQPIIAEWKKAIDFYGGTFDSKTIVLTLGVGLLNFKPKQQQSAQAREEILAYFVSNSTSIGNNLKATQTSGLKACRGEAAMADVKKATQNPAFSPRILGGAQFNSSVSDKGTATMGCLDCAVENRQCDRKPSYHPCCSLSVAQAAQNVLYKYFNETLVGDKYCNTEGECGVKGDAPLHYLQLYKEDMLAAENDNQLQSLLMTANQDLLSMNQAPVPRSTVTWKPSFSLAPTRPPETLVKPDGVYALIEWNKEPDAKLWQRPFIDLFDGLVIRTYWMDVNPSPGVYNWSYLDRQFANAEQYNKKIRLIIVPGFYSPQYVLQQVRTVVFEVPQGPFEEENRSLPVPWDEIYLNLWFEFVDKVGERYGNRPEFSYISVTGSNSHNGEVNLPHGSGGRGGGEEVDKKWRKLAEEDGVTGRENQISYVKQKLEEAWYTSIDHFDHAFGEKGKHYTIAIIDNSFPIGNDREREEDFRNNLIEYGVTHYPDSFGLQNNGLNGRPICPGKTEIPTQWDLVERYSDKILTGFQTRHPSLLYETENCEEKDEAKILQRAVDNALERNVNFIEIYKSDILDTSKQDVIRYAREQLIKTVIPSPIPTSKRASPTVAPTPTLQPPRFPWWSPRWWCKYFPTLCW